MPMPKLDHLALDQLCSKLLEPFFRHFVMEVLLSCSSSTQSRQLTGLNNFKTQKLQIKTQIVRFYEAGGAGDNAYFYQAPIEAGTGLGRGNSSRR
jgi:hypothetical protein